MKKIFTILAVLTFAYSGYSQNTTEEEYNWMTKGYKIMLSSGLDMKKGYIFDDASEVNYSVGSYSFDYKPLKRTNDNSLAGVIIVAKSTVSGNSYYFGLPIGEVNGNEYQTSPLFINFLTDVQDLDRNMTNAFFTSLWEIYAMNMVPEKVR